MVQAHSPPYEVHQRSHDEWAIKKRGASRASAVVDAYHAATTKALEYAERAKAPYVEVFNHTSRLELRMWNNYFEALVVAPHPQPLGRNESGSRQWMVGSKSRYNRQNGLDSGHGVGPYDARSDAEDVARGLMEDAPYRRIIIYKKDGFLSSKLNNNSLPSTARGGFGGSVR